MKIKTIFLSLFLTMLVMVPAMAQEAVTDEALSIAEQFPYPVLRGWSNSAAAVKYYRFDSKIPVFDPVDLSYFPQESSDYYSPFDSMNGYRENSEYEPDWALLGRWKDGKNDMQQIYLEKPAAYQIIHGKEIGKRCVNLRNFYLYMDLFVLDNYPENTGSCYIYFSNSTLTGVSKNSYGLLIDPESGIYQVTNYDAGETWWGGQSYNPFYVEHKMKKILGLTPDSYPVIENQADTASIGAAGYPKENLDKKFTEDWAYLKNSYRIPAGSEVHPYRVEVVRMNGKTTVFINGKIVVENLKDNIKTWSEDGNILDKVSWSYGPLLNKGGMTVTCAVGSFAIYATGPNGD